MKENFFSCNCIREKSHKLVFDGGVVGSYCIEICQSCYKSQGKKFLIKEEILG